MIVFHHCVSTAKLTQKNNCSKAKDIIKDTFTHILLPMNLNKLMKYASKYRQKIRFVQRFWKTKN